jgi:hypothetical protein
MKRWQNATTTQAAKVCFLTAIKMAAAKSRLSDFIIATFYPVPPVLRTV